MPSNHLRCKFLKRKTNPAPAAVTNQVKVVATAANNLHSPIIYPIAVIKASKNPQAAKTFTQYLTRAAAKNIFEKFGFGIAR
jgi:molybdate transport system substrate-binding protein